MPHVVAEMIMLFKLPLMMRVVVCGRENEASAELEECRGHRLDCFFPGGRQHVLFLSISYLQSTFTYYLSQGVALSRRFQNLFGKRLANVNSWDLRIPRQGTGLRSVASAP